MRTDFSSIDSQGILDPFWKFRQTLTKFPKRIKYTIYHAGMFVSMQSVKMQAGAEVAAKADDFSWGPICGY